MSDTPSVLLVTNPLSGQGRGVSAAAAARARFADRGVDVAEVHGATAADSVELVRAAVTDATPPDAVVCAGGDGLVCLALQAIAGSGVPLGLVPGGTGNDLARELGIPDDVTAAVDIVLAGKARSIDLGEIDSGTVTAEYGGPLRFATITGTGFDARVTLRANRMRRPKGSLRYTVAALAELTGGLAVPYRIELSGVPGESGDIVVETPAVMVAVGNGRTYGGGMLICPDARLDDGLLDLTVVGAMSRRDMLRMLPALSSGKRIEHPAVTQYRAATITLIAPAAPATADGEPAGVLPATFRAISAAQPVLVP